MKSNEIRYCDLSDAGASWDSFTQVLTNEKSSMLQFTPKKALVLLNDSYDLRLQMRLYELNNSLISWKGSYDASKKILIEEIQEVKIAWKTMLQFKIREALVVLNDSYDLRLQMRPYELNNSLISWEGSYDTSKKILIEEIQEVKIA